MKLKRDHWQYLGSLSFVALAALSWSTLLFVPKEDSSRTLSSQGTAYEFYMSGNHRAAWDTLMAVELERRPLNETVAGSVEGLIFDLYMEPTISLGASEVAEGFGKLLSRKNIAPNRRAIWEAYERALLDIDSQKYSVKAFLNKVESLQSERLQKSTGGDRKALPALNETFRVYFAHAQKKWFETRLSGERVNLRWLFAAGFAGSLYYAQGRAQLEEYLILCSTSNEACLPEDVAQAGEILRMLRGLDLPIGDEEP